MRAMKREMYFLTYRKSLIGLARKVWHKRFFHKLKENCISAKLLNIVTDFLHQWNQRVALNRMDCNWSRGSTSFYTWTIVFSNIHKRLIWWFSIECQIICRWYISIFCGRKYEQISRRVKRAKISYWTFQGEKIKSRSDRDLKSCQVIASNSLRKVDFLLKCGFQVISIFYLFRICI